ncbi:MAG: phosphopantetheine-binding protein [Candidatus Aenigmatarchaeota archaeon]
MDPIVWIKNWFKEKVGLSNQELDSNLKENYFEKGWIDSFTFISFISDLEKTYRIRFSNEEFQKEEFLTIEGLADIVRRKVGERRI